MPRYDRIRKFGDMHGELYIASIHFDTISVSAQSTLSQDFSLSGVKVGDVVIGFSGIPDDPLASPPLRISGIYILSNDTITVRFNNPTTASVSIDPATLNIIIFRPANIV